MMMKEPLRSVANLLEYYASLPVFMTASIIRYLHWMTIHKCMPFLIFYPTHRQMVLASA